MTSPRILVVDDEMIIARELESRLQHLGYDVPGIASSGEDAIELAKSTRPDLVLMDIVLKGGMDGIDAATEIRKGRSVPIIYVTAYTDDTTLKRARITEPFGYIVKPFSERELRSNIEMALYKHGVEERLRRVERWFAASMERVAEGVVTTDHCGVVTFINAEAQALTGRRGGEAIGKNIEEIVRLVNRADQTPFRDIVRRTLDGGLVTHPSDETQLIDGRGNRCEVDVIAARVQEAGGAGGVVLVLRDLSERNRMRQTLRETEAELRRKNEALKDADRRKDEFLATLAHELRNPLAPIRNGLQILSLSPDGETGEATLGMMERQLAHMVRLVDDLLDVSRVSRGRIEIRRERLRLDDLLDSTVEASRTLIEAAGHELTITTTGEPVWLDGDLIRLSQVVSNILHNAAKYTPPGGSIALSAEVDGPWATIRVADNGAGISAEMLPTVFDMFTQVDQTLNRSQGGLGIGLCLVKKIAEMHDATVEAASPGIGLGSMFTIRLPVAPPPDAQDNGGASAGGDEHASFRSRLRVLIVDDNIDSARSLATILDFWRHSTRVAHDGPGAIAIATEYQPDVIFLDIGLPGMDGYEVARRIRTCPRLSGVTIAALTGWGSESDRMRTRDAGFDLHMVKPVAIHEIEAFLKKATEERDQLAASLA